MATFSDSFQIARLGPPTLISPLTARFSPENFIADGSRVVAVSDADALVRALAQGGGIDAVPTLERAGPRARVYFDGGSIACGIVTCGGLCPGLNNVIRSLVLTLWHGYGVRRVLGFRYGFAGLGAAPPEPPLVLQPEVVQGIHEHGGSLLGTSRGPQDLGTMVDTLVREGVSLLFAVGGDGTLRGASAIAAQAHSRGVRLAVVGVPKTIDNDLSWIERSFGFATAVEVARQVIAAAHSEAQGVVGGIGLVRLMGRHSGFIAAHASLASNDVNFCLVPEVSVQLEGEQGLLRALESRLQARRHAVIVVAEGAMQDVLQDGARVERDASGNVRLVDVGLFLKERVQRHFAALGRGVSVRYFDPSYYIRSQAPAAVDAEYCLRLSQQAVHAGMCGRTDMVVGYWNQRFTHVPIARAVEQRKRVDPNGALWRAVLEATGQRAWR